MNNSEEFEDAEPGLFNAKDLYTDHVLPLLKELEAMCGAADLPYVMAICYSHEHTDEFCRHGMGITTKTPIGCAPISQQVAAIVLTLQEEQALMVLQFLKKMIEFFEDGDEQGAARFN